jgi:hypothetical protein
VRNAGLSITDEMRELDRFYISGEIDFWELGRRSRQV